MRRRAFLFASSLVGGLCLARSLFASDSLAEMLRLRRSGETKKRKAQAHHLREMLKSQLRPRSPQEFAFLDRVVDMVEQGELPLTMVNATFNWARRRWRRYRFPYFQRAMQINAAKLGIKIEQPNPSRN